MKKIYYCLFCGLLCLTTFITYAQHGTTSEISWDIKDGTLTVSGVGAMPDFPSDKRPWDAHRDSIFAVVIEYGVTSIGDWAFSNNNKLTSITIPYSVTSIGDCAFIHCSSLASVTIPESVNSIGYMAFMGCNIKTINIPCSVISIGNSAFYSVSYSSNTVLTSIQVDDNNSAYSSENGVLFDKAKTLLIQYPPGKTDKHYTIPNSVISILGGAFAGCSGLTSITIPNSVTTIGDMTFFACKELVSVSIGNSVTTIGGNAFSYCNSLVSITIPNSVTSIENYAFFHCSNLTSINIGNSVLSIGYRAFDGCSSLVSIIIPNSVTTIGDMAFMGCHSLTSVTIPNSVTYLGGWAFRECQGLESIHVDEDNITYSSENGVLFNKAKTILLQYPMARPDTNYIIPNSVEYIDWGAFYSCNITSLTIPSSVIDFGNGVFHGCSSLKEIINHAPRPRFSADQFNSVDKSQCILRVPAEAIEIYRNAETWRDFAKIEAIIW